MSEQYCVIVSDEVDEELEQIRDEEIKSALMQRLEELAERDDNIQAKQDELHERMGVDKSEEDVEELSEPELKHEIQRFLRGERRTDPRLDR